MAVEPKNVTVPWVAGAPERGDRLVMVTAYDFPQGRAADAAGVDIVLVGDSLAMVVLGHPDTLSVTMDEMIHHTRAVRRGVKRALLVADMPYGSFHLGTDQAVGALPDDYRTVFLLKDVDGLSNEEIASALDLTVPAVKSRLHRARLALREKLGEFFGG